MSAVLPRWVESLNEEDLQFARRFLLSSGSLKALAKEYGISYPTVRARLDRLIAKVRAADEPASADPFHRLVRGMMADGEVSAGTARKLIEAHAASLKAAEEEEREAQ
ncbi:MAG: DUF2089 family protein [Candidatus Hydrogenedentes bacterium]|nr:DUF2089 family protein [Candidatus Hydrogenedentota bacterium]